MTATTEPRTEPWLDWLPALRYFPKVRHAPGVRPWRPCPDLPSAYEGMAVLRGGWTPKPAREGKASKRRRRRRR
jgi:hypothetical protein